MIATNFVHGTTAVLSWHVQKFVAIWWPTTELKQQKIVSEIGPCLTNPIMHQSHIPQRTTLVHISVPKWCIVGYGTGALWGLVYGIAIVLFWASIMYHFLTLRFHSFQKSFLMEDKEPCILHGQYHSCWLPGDTRCQGISHNDIDLIFLENPSLSTPRVK